MKKKRKNKKNEGFTLAELMVSTVIMLICIVGILASYLRCLELNEMTKNASISINAAKSRMEQIKNTQFNQIAATYHQVPFTIAGLDGMGVSYVDSTNPELLEVAIYVSFRQSNARVIGDDKDVDGSIDSGEDSDGDLMLNSKIEIVSNIYDM